MIVRNAITSAVLLGAVLVPVRAAAAAAAVSRPGAQPSMSSCPHGLSAASDAHFRVWACDNRPVAVTDERKALAAAQGVYGPMTGLMGAPLPDCKPGSKACKSRGGDGRIDIYLLNPGQTLRREGDTNGLAKIELGAVIGDAVHGTVSSGYILLRRKMLADPVKFKSVLVHEFFHVLSDRYNNSLKCIHGGQHYWFFEASAKWAESYFARDAAPTEVYPWFSDFQDAPGVSLTDATRRSPYADFIWPFFMQQEQGAKAIADAWRAMAGAASCAQLTAAMDTAFPFGPNFGRFALENFDSRLPNIRTSKLQWPVDFGPRYQQVDGDGSSKAGTEPFPQILPKEKHLIEKDDSTQSRTVGVADLAAQYDDWQSGPAALSVEFNFSGIKNRKNLDITAIAAEEPGFEDTAEPFKTIPVDGDYLRICAAADTDGTLAGLRVHVILADHSTAPSGAAGGTYTVTDRSACAASLSGSVSYTWSETFPTNTWHETVDLKNLKFMPVASFGWSNPVKGSFTYTSNYQGNDSGSLKGANITVGNAYVVKYHGGGNPDTPYLYAAMIGAGSSITLNGALDGCPIDVAPGGLSGKYSKDFGSVSLKCENSGTNSSGNPAQITVTGHLDAADPILCGIWTPDCSVTAPPPSARR